MTKENPDRRHYTWLAQTVPAEHPIHKAVARLANPNNLVDVPKDLVPEFVAWNLAHATNEFERIFYSHKGRRIYKWHHYLAIYDRYLHQYRQMAAHSDHNDPSRIAPGKQLRILEIGVMSGGSLELWRRYFGAEALVVGIDINPACKAYERDGCLVRIGDQSDAGFLASVIDEMGGVDIVIDDGSHIASHQFASFMALFPRVSEGGLYICEDTHTAYWERWEGGYKRPGTFIETAKDVVDHLHEWYAPVPTALSPLNLKTQVMAIAFHDSMVVIEKGQKSRPYAIGVGTSGPVAADN